MYVDYVLLIGNKIAEPKQLQKSMIKIFREGNFKLQKWHSNIKELKDGEGNDQQTYAKSQPGVRYNETKN